jgi:polysaccharide export outer membrane protein
MAKVYFFSLFAFIFITLITSCKNVNSHVMFKIPKDGSFKFDSLPMNPFEDYRLGPGDRISFIFGPNKGEQIVFNQSNVEEITQIGLRNQSNRRENDFLIRQDGTVDLPLIGVYTAKGLTTTELEIKLKEELSKNFIEPFVMVRVTNQRVVVFNGRGNANVVPIQNNNTTLLEAIAMSGGIVEEGRASSIRIMRRTNVGKREIYNVDLSKIEGLREADMILQGNDYIYIDYKPRIASSVFREVSPWLSLITTSLAVIAIFRR